MFRRQHESMLRTFFLFFLPASKFPVRVVNSFYEKVSYSKACLGPFQTSASFRSMKTKANLWFYWLFVWLFLCLFCEGCDSWIIVKNSLPFTMNDVGGKCVAFFLGFVRPKGRKLINFHKLLTHDLFLMANFLLCKQPSTGSELAPSIMK